MKMRVGPALTAIGTCIKKLLLTEIYLDLKRGERNERGDVVYLISLIN